MKNGDDIHYFKDTSTFDQYLHANYPDPSLGYMDNTTGSDMFYILKEFLKNTEFLCGSTIMIAAKRYPNKMEIEDLISELQKNHVFVYILSSDTPSGGSNPSAMFNLATRTNGYCEFSADKYLADMYSDAQNIAAAPNQIVASNFAVSGKGNLSVPFKVFKDTEAFFEIIYQDHKVDGSLISLNVTVTDELGFEQSSIDYDGNTEQTGFFDGLRGLEKTVQYYLNIDYEYEEGRQEVMVVRMYSGDNPDNWLPFNN